MLSKGPDIPVSQISGYAEVAEIIAGRPLFHFGGVVSFLYLRQAEHPNGGFWPCIELVMHDISVYDPDRVA